MKRKGPFKNIIFCLIDSSEAGFYFIRYIIIAYVLYVSHLVECEWRLSERMNDIFMLIIQLLQNKNGADFLILPILWWFRFMYYFNVNAAICSRHKTLQIKTVQIVNGSYSLYALILQTYQTLNKSVQLLMLIKM